MGRIIRLTEQDLARIVRRVINENEMIFEDEHQGMKSIANQLKSYGYKQETVGTNSVWKGDEEFGSGVVFYNDTFHVYIKGKSAGNFKIGPDYDSSVIVKKVVSILKNY